MRKPQMMQKSYPARFLETAAKPEDENPDTPEAVLPFPVRSRGDVKAFALLGLLILALLFTLYLARDFFLPVVIAVLLNFLLWPVVRALKAIWIPEKIGAAIVIAALLGGLGFGAYKLSGPASAWMAKAPSSLRLVARKVRPLQEPVEKMSEAARQVQKITDLNGQDSDPRTVQIADDNLTTVVFNSTWSFLAGAAVATILLYFLLASGDLFLRKIIRLLDDPRDKKRAVRIARKLERSISSYLLTISLINLGLGLAVALALYLLDMPNPLLWGVMATALNFIPYLGAVVGLTVISVVAFATFESLGVAVTVALVYLALTALEGLVVTPVILGKRLTLNPVVVFVGLLFWTWLWGPLGALLAVPLLATFKLFCEHFKPLHPVADFMGP